MEGTVKFYNDSKGWGYIAIEGEEKDTYFHISNVIGELRELIETRKMKNEPVTFEKEASKKGGFQAKNVNLDLTKRSVGYVHSFENGYGKIEDFHTNELYHVHHSKIIGSDKKYIKAEIDAPVLFTKSVHEKGKEALEVVLLDDRCNLEKYAVFDNFNESLTQLKAKSESEEWDYIVKPTGYNPVLYSYINYTFSRVQLQGKIIEGSSSKENRKFSYFNTGLVTSEQDEIFAYFEKIGSPDDEDKWGVTQPSYSFLEFETDQSIYRKYFPRTPDIATYFSEAEVTELIFDTSINGGKIVIDKEHIKNRKNRFPISVNNLDDDRFFDEVAKSIDLAVKRTKRNYKTAIPHYYDGKIQFLLPLCMLSKSKADLALVVNKEEQIYKAHTVLTLDQALNNARLLAKPDREWLNP